MIGVSAGFAVAAVAGRRRVDRLGATTLLLVYAGYLMYLLRSSGPG
jgi:hypothetical protein